MRVLTSILLLGLAIPAAAQEREIRGANLPDEQEWELLRMYESGARRFDGAATIEAGEVVTGDVVAMGGPLRVLGRVDGDVAMVDGDVVLEPGGEVTGSITVVGGEVMLENASAVGGTITTYGASTESWRDRTRDRDDDWWDEDDRWRDRDDDRWDGAGHWGRGHSRLTLRTGASYNRVEGLPLMFGPIIQTGGPAPLRVEALAIWRSESESLDTDRMGYRIEVQQFLDGGRRYGVGGSAYSVVDPMDRWQISDLEASLAAAVFHDDYRDHFDRTGWSVFGRAEPLRGLEARVEYRAEEYATVAAGDPWTLFHNESSWRHQPLVAEGDLQLLGGSLELDLRDDDEDPEWGWYGRLSLQRPVGGELTRPELAWVLPSGIEPELADPAGGLAAEAVDTDFTAGLLDLRRYTPVGYASQLAVRLVAGGSLGGEALPPQYQHALGGLGTLPGFATFHADCGARSAFGGRDERSYFLSYGCDRFALAQVEYRGRLSLDFGFGDPDYDDEDWWDGIDVDLSPTWVVFFDAAQGWAAEEPGRPDRGTGALYDAGVGFLLDDLGIYAALPLNGDVEQEPRFFIRLGRRF